jgi:hypothetical protein
LLPYLGQPYAPQPGDRWFTLAESRDRYLAAMLSSVGVYQCLAMPKSGQAPFSVNHPLHGGKVQISQLTLDYVVNSFDLQNPTAGDQNAGMLEELNLTPGVTHLVQYTEAYYNMRLDYHGFHDLWSDSHLWFGAAPRMSTDTRHGDTVPCSYYDAHAAAVSRKELTVDRFHN